MMQFNEKDEKLSVLICVTLDQLGYKKEMIAVTRKTNEELARKTISEQQKYGLDFTCEYVGSRGEGVMVTGSDTDIMLVIKNTVCVDHGVNEGNLVVLQADYTKSAPGYTRVTSVCINDCTLTKLIVFLGENIYLSETGSPYLSSVGVRNELRLLYAFSNHPWNQLPNGKSMCNGPAITSQCKSYNANAEYDIVFSVYYYGKDILHKWAKRKRSHAWPSRKTIKKISEMEGYIVPVGDKLSENQSLEWRICFTTAEKKLVSTLDNVQIKLYLLLKVFTKRILKPVCKEITSYIVKNVVFWILETTCQRKSSEKCLIYLFRKSIHFIMQCLQNSYLPNYMIPERNLLRGLGLGKRKNAVTKFLSDYLKQGGSIILRLPNLQRCISLFCANPKLMIKYGKWSEEEILLRNRLCSLHDVNLLSLYLSCRTLGGFLTECLKHSEIREDTARYLDHVVPNWRYLHTDDIGHRLLLNDYIVNKLTL